MRVSDTTAPQALSACPLPPRPIRPPRVKVLVILNADGYVEVYADDHIDVHVAQRLHVGTQQAERLADELIDVTLPRVYRDLYYPRNLRKAGQCRKVTVEQFLDTRAELNVLAAIQKLENMVRLVLENET